MHVMGCEIHCTCGGLVERLHEGVYYYLTDRYEIVFQGICNDCGKGVKVTKPIQDLMMMCPVGKGRAN